MKKIIMSMFIFTLLLTGCSNKETKLEEPINNEYIEEEILNPTVEWFKLYKGNDNRNCVTLEVKNPNNFAIGFSYDLVFYKDDNVVKTESNWAMTGIGANKTGIIYGDIKIPSSTEADRVEIENIYATRFEWKTIEGTFNKTFIDNEVQYFDVKYSEKPDHTEIWVVLYNDLNGNNNVEENEFVNMGLLAPYVSILDTKGEIHIPSRSEGYDYTDYKIYNFSFVRN